MDHWFEKLAKVSYIDQLIKKLSSGNLKGSNATYWDVIRMLYERTKDHDLLGYSRSMAFSFTLALFPAVIFLFSIIPYFGELFGIQKLDYEIMIFLEEMMPTSTYDAAADTIEGIVRRKQFGLVSFGFIFAVYLATNGILTLMNTFDRIYKQRNTRNYIQSNLVALFITGILAVTFVFSIIFIVFSQNFVDWFFHEFYEIKEDYIVILFLVLKIAVMFLIFFISIATIYVLAPSREKKWNYINQGSVMASLLSLATTIGFTYYINSFGTYNKFYGSIGAMIAIMVWIWLLSLIIVCGFELNSSIELAKLKKDGRRGMKE